MPVAAPDDAHAGVRALAAHRGKGGATFAAIVEPGQIGLQLDRLADREDRSQRDAALAIGGGPVGGAAILGDDRHEAVAARELRRQRHRPAAQFRAAGRDQIHRIAAAVKTGQRQRAEQVGAAAVQFDRPGERARALIAAATATGDAHRRQPLGQIGGEGHPAAERVGLRHAVEQQQRPARRIAAQAAQRDPLGRGMRRARIGAAELGGARHVAQHILEPPAGGGRQPFAVDFDIGIGGFAGRRIETTAGHDQFLRLGGERQEDKQGQGQPHFVSVWSGLAAANAAIARAAASAATSRG